MEQHAPKRARFGMRVTSAADLTPFERDALAKGQLVIDRGHLVPVIRGGDDLAEALTKLEAELKTAREQNTGGNNDDRITELERQLTVLKAATGGSGQGGGTGGGTGQGGGTPATTTVAVEEIERLRGLEKRLQLETQADQIVDQVMQGLAAERVREQDELRKTVEDVLKRRLEGGAVDDAVARALATSRTGSRFLGQGADPDFAKRIAEGGSYRVQDPNTPVAVGEHRGVKEMLDPKVRWGNYIVAIFRQAKGLPLTETHQQFLQAVHGKALAEGTPSAGGYLVPEEWMPDILGLLGARAVVRRANPRIQPFNKLMHQTSVSTTATAYYTLENAAITPSQPSLAETPLLTPHNLTALVAASNYLLNDAAAADAWVRDDMVNVITMREDLAFLRGDGTGGEPVGFRNKAGVTLDPLVPPANGFYVTLAQLRRIRAVLRAKNAYGEVVRPVWFFGPNFITYLETIEEQSGGAATGRLLLDSGLLTINDDQSSGVIDGVPFFSTSIWPENITYGTTANTTEIMLVNMAQAIVGESQQLELDASTEATYTPDGGTTYVSAFQNNQSVFRGIMRHDVAHRRPDQIVIQRGVKAV